MSEPRDPAALSPREPVAPAGREVARQGGLVFAAAFAVLVYEFAFELTKPSPISRATVGELAQTLSYAVLIPTVLAVVVAPLSVASTSLLRRRWTAVPRDALSLSVVGGLLFTGLLSFAQNLTYSASGWGLNRGSDLLTKAAFGMFAAAGAGLAIIKLARTRARGHGWVASLVMAALALPSAIIVGSYLARTPQVPPLHTAGPVRPLNVIVLSADAVEADHLTAYGYSRPTTPFLAAHVGEFMKFENAFTNNGNTTGSITALLTGRSPLETGVVYPPDQLHTSDALLTLPYLLARAGYRTENWAVPHYADARDQNLARAFGSDNGSPQRGTVFGGFATGVGVPGWFVRDRLGNAKDLVLDVLGIREMTNPYAAVSTIVGNTITDDEREAGVREAIARKRPFFVNTHFMETHGPAYDLEDPLFSAGKKQTKRWETDFYDDSLRLFDTRIKHVYQALERAGKLDDTILVVTSDHGIEYDATKRVPLLIRLPDARNAGSYAPNVERIDVAPTVLRALGYEPPAWMTGLSLLDPESLPDDREILATSSSVREFSNNQGFHAGASDVVVTAIRCRWFTQRDPQGKTRTGPVDGSTSTCDERPEDPPPFGRAGRSAVGPPAHR